MDLQECSKDGCTTIACHRHSKKYGYICSDCFTKLIQEASLTYEAINKVFRRYSLVKLIRGEGYCYDTLSVSPREKVHLAQ